MDFGGQTYEVIAKDEVGNFLETYKTDFRELITAPDTDAFCNENTFWSTVAEEMGYGII